MSNCPKRPPYFAHRLVRLLFKSCAAQELGHAAISLIVHIAHTEDAVRYQYPVKFWNSQLMSILAFNSPKQLIAARQKAIDAGWLVYERSSNREVAKYWTTIPPAVAKFNDEPVEENASEFGNVSENGKVNVSENGTNSGTNSGKTSIPIPVPKRTSSTDVDGDRSKEPSEKKPRRKPKSRTYSPDFLAWWNHYPRKVGKPTAARAFNSAIARISDERSIDSAAALNWLIERTDAYTQATADQEAKFTKHPGPWLNEERYNDEAASSKGSGSNGSKLPDLAVEARERRKRKAQMRAQEAAS